MKQKELLSSAQKKSRVSFKRKRLSEYNRCINLNIFGILHNQIKQVTS